MKEYLWIGGQVVSIVAVLFFQTTDKEMQKDQRK